MRGVTHAGIGAAAAALAFGGSLPVAGAAVAGSLLPDIDCGSSKAAVLGPATSLIAAFGCGAAAYYRYAPPVPMALAALWFLAAAVLPHRTFTHSLLGMVLPAVAAARLFPHLAWPFVMGWALHLAADALTSSGLVPLWPAPIQVSAKAVRTGGLTDLALGLAAWAVALAVYAQH